VTSHGVHPGHRLGPFEAHFDADLVQKFAAATVDPSRGVQNGKVVPPMALVTQIWEAQVAAFSALVPESLRLEATGGVHGEHELVVHRPIVPGEVLRIWVDGVGSHPAGRNSLVTLRYTAIDAGGEVVAEQWWTTVYLGTNCEPMGLAPPDHTFPDEARQRLRGSYVVDVDLEMARRYAEVSGDWSAHHFEAEAARQSSFERVFLHGLCTMALCAQAVVELVADGDPDRLRRIAVRFATPTFLGEPLTVRLYDVAALTYAFEADSTGKAVITHGRAELR
jgi:acyl dehydratase